MMCSLLVKIKPQIYTLTHETIGAWSFLVWVWVWVEPFWHTHLAFLPNKTFPQKIYASAIFFSHRFLSKLHIQLNATANGYQLEEGAFIYIWTASEKIEYKMSVRLCFSISCGTCLPKNSKIFASEHCSGVRFLLIFLTNTLLVICSHHSFFTPFHT